MRLICGKCKLNLPESAFYPSQRRQGSYCRDCARIYRREYGRAVVEDPQTGLGVWRNTEYMKRYRATEHGRERLRVASRNYYQRNKTK